MSVSTTHFLNGDWCSASNAKTFQVTNPATGEVVDQAGVVEIGCNAPPNLRHIRLRPSPARDRHIVDRGSLTDHDGPMESNQQRRRWRRFGVSDREAQRIVRELWSTLEDERRVVASVEVSANVSTNRVFLLRLDDETRVFAKVSNYGSGFLFREDHDRVNRLCCALANTRWSNFLARPLTKNGRVHTISGGPAGETWGVLYEEVERLETLPRILDNPQIENLASEVASFHRACSDAGHRVSIPQTSTSISSDVIHLLDLVSDRTASRTLQLSVEEIDIVQRHANRFLQSLEDFGYADLPRIPVFVDWNLGNFSIEKGPRESQPDRFMLYSRWDYDWFRIDTRLLDFYFLSRVSSQTGDRTEFSYGVHTLGEPRFLSFLRAYHATNPLTEADVQLIVETYRFFILHYVLSVGDHFFRHDLWDVFRRDAVSRGLPSVDTFDRRPLLRALG